MISHVASCAEVPLSAAPGHMLSKICRQNPPDTDRGKSYTSLLIIREFMSFHEFFKLTHFDIMFQSLAGC